LDDVSHCSFEAPGRFLFFGSRAPWSLPFCGICWVTLQVCCFFGWCWAGLFLFLGLDLLLRFPSFPAVPQGLSWFFFAFYFGVSVIEGPPLLLVLVPPSPVLFARPSPVLSSGVFPVAFFVRFTFPVMDCGQVPFFYATPAPHTPFSPHSNELAASPFFCAGPLRTVGDSLSPL